MGGGKRYFHIDTCLKGNRFYVATYRSLLFTGVVKIESAYFYNIIAVNFFSPQSLLVETTIFPNPVSNVSGTRGSRVDN